MAATGAVAESAAAAARRLLGQEAQTIGRWRQPTPGAQGISIRLRKVPMLKSVTPLAAAPTETGLVRVLAAAFQRRSIAEAVKQVLDRRFALGTGIVRVADLGHAGDPDGPDAVLAGRFDDDSRDAVLAALTGAGGTVVIDIDEALTHN